MSRVSDPLTRARVTAALLALALTAFAGATLARDSSGERPRVFPTPRAALAALTTACKGEDIEGLTAIFGREHARLIHTSDAEADRLARKRFEKACAVATSFDEQPDGSVLISVGAEAWPFPIPLVRAGEGWRFDAAAGAEEILNRRIGRNELETIAACRTWLRAQAEYASVDRDGDGVLEYAQLLFASEGEQDGLYWPAPEGSAVPPSPLEPLVAAADPNYVRGKLPGSTWHGYHYRHLHRQGSRAPGGAHRYVLNGNMIAGCALIAWPADHGSTGIMTFMVSHHGQVYEKDLGPQTERLARKMRLFLPGAGWRPIAQD